MKLIYKLQSAPLTQRVYTHVTISHGDEAAVIDIVKVITPH